MMLRSMTAAATAALVFVTASACTRGEGLDTSKMPENVRADYSVFAHKCSKCHSLARPLSANITDDEQWVLYVNRMRRQPGSGISYTDQDAILRFLRYYAADLRRQQAEKHGAPVDPHATQSVPVLTPTSPPAVDGGGP
jgi:hypothetical protein